MKARQKTRIGRIFADGRQIDEALKSAVREALRTHQRRNVPVVVWRDGRMAVVPARELTAAPPVASPKKKAVSTRGR
jgi:hypothetical protein